jgi:hypothetical protein
LSQLELEKRFGGITSLDWKLPGRFQDLLLLQVENGKVGWALQALLGLVRVANID